MSNLIRYTCNNENCVCDYFRGGAAEKECPLCNTKDITIIEFGVKE